MKKVAGLIVDGHKFFLVFMLVIAVLCGLLIPKVEINTDMTKYLPDDSSMAQGIDIMAENFSDMSVSQTIRVMFKGINEEQIVAIKTYLEQIENVDSVSYVAGSEDYNKDGYTKFVVNTSFTYGSPEELAIEETIEKAFSAYDMELMNDNTSTMELPWVIIGIALALLLVILFIMSGSWFEPILFLIAIGLAVVMNMGTNLVLGSVSQITMSIAAILQLVLSMDYSIILMNRYRQEKNKYDDIEDAMKSAWQSAFSSVMSSGMTTVIGLIMLVFMSFKIGMDLGIVLAKGVFFSMLCVLTVLPALILIFDEKIEDTEKKELHIPMGLLSRFQYKARKPIAIFFVILFVVSFFGQNLSKTVYTLSPEDPIADVFTPSNPIVVLYNNDDEQKMSELAVQLEKDENVKSVMSYSTTLGRKFTSKGMVDMIDSMGIPMSIDSSLLDVIYYNYYGGELLPMTTSEVMNFISKEVVTNPMFSSFISSDMQSSIDSIKVFSDAKELTTPKTVDELSTTFGMPADDLKQVFVLYYSKNGGADYGTMTMSEFSSFVVNDVSTNEQYASMFDEETKAQLNQLEVLTNKDAIVQKIGPAEMAQVMGIAEDDVLLLYAYHYEYQKTDGNVVYDDVIADYVAWNIVECTHKMSVKELINFVNDNKATFGSMMEGDQLSQIETGKKIVDATMSGKAFTPSQMANIIGFDSTQIKQLYLLRTCKYGDTSSWKISVQNFVKFIDSDVLNNKAYASFFDADTASKLKSAKTIINAVVSGKSYTASEMAGILGGLSDELNANTVEMLYLYNSGLKNSNPEWTLTIEEMFRYVSEDMLNDPRFSSLLDENMKNDIRGMKTQLDDSINQLLGKDYSLMMVETSLPTESEETSKFMASITALFDDNLPNKVYLIGNTPMSYEMEQSFDKELLTITLLTAVAIFLVVLFTFRSLLIPAALVLLVQCGVYLTMTVNGLAGYSIYYLALLIVQCILMGATIDYGILFTNYYRENRKTMDIQGALLSAYNGSIHTILTSGLIMVIVTGAIGMSPVDPTIAQICRIISIGALSAILLILFVLPGLIATCDRFVTKDKKKKKQKELETVPETPVETTEEVTTTEE